MTYSETLNNLGICGVFVALLSVLIWLLGFYLPSLNKHGLVHNIKKGLAGPTASCDSQSNWVTKGGGFSCNAEYNLKPESSKLPDMSQNTYKNFNV